MKKTVFIFCKKKNALIQVVECYYLQPSTCPMYDTCHMKHLDKEKQALLDLFRAVHGLKEKQGGDH